MNAPVNKSSRIYEGHPINKLLDGIIFFVKMWKIWNMFCR